jgi:hypothetical protein
VDARRWEETRHSAHHSAASSRAVLLVQCIVLTSCCYSDSAVCLPSAPPFKVNPNGIHHIYIRISSQPNPPYIPKPHPSDCATNFTTSGTIVFFLFPQQYGHRSKQEFERFSITVVILFPCFFCALYLAY